MRNVFKTGLLSRLKKAKEAVPQKIAVLSVNSAKESFRLQRFNDDNTDPWQKRKRNKDPGRAILVQYGRLRRSIRAGKVSWREIVVVADAVYARIHNEGIGKMPKRQFMGRSRKLTREITKEILQEIKTVFK